MSFFLSCHLLVAFPHQFFCLSVEGSVNFIFQQDMKEAINSFVDFINEYRIVLELIMEAVLYIVTL